MSHQFFFLLYRNGISLCMTLQIMFNVLCMLILIHVVYKEMLLWRNCVFGDIKVDKSTSADQATCMLFDHKHVQDKRLKNLVIFILYFQRKYLIFYFFSLDL